MRGKQKANGSSIYSPERRADSYTDATRQQNVPKDPKSRKLGKLKSPRVPRDQIGRIPLTLTNFYPANGDQGVVRMSFLGKPEGSPKELPALAAKTGSNFFNLNKSGS